MRFHTTIQHGLHRDAWRDAVKAQDVFAEAGDDGERYGGTVDADHADQREHAALHRFFVHPATTSAELQEKIAAMRERGPLNPDSMTWNDAETAAWFDRMERDLIAMTRPNVSPIVAKAFREWALAHAMYWSRPDWTDAESDPLMRAEEAARDALYQEPCTTPGDFIAKAFVELLDEYGARGHGSAGLAFMVDEAKMVHAADILKLRDIMASDLGCCMAALGADDFDAKEWLVQALRHGLEVSVVHSREGPCPVRGLALGVGDDGRGDVGHILQRLTANGLGKVAADRCMEIGDEIEANWPSLVVIAEPAA